MPQICPRCTKILPGDPDDGSIHTCTPTDYARNLEARVAELEAELLAYKGERILLKQEIESLRRNDPNLNRE